MSRRTELGRDLVRRVRGLSVATTDTGTEGQRDRTSLELLLDDHLYAVARLWASGTGDEAGRPADRLDPSWPS